MNSLGRRKVYALALVAALVAGITPGIAAEGAETVQEVVANFTGTPIIKTDSDFYNSTKYPAIVNVGRELKITVNNLQPFDVVKIMGEDYSISSWIYLGTPGEGTVNWKTKNAQSGIYKIQVLRGSGRSVTLDSEELETLQDEDGWVDLEELENTRGADSIGNLTNHRVKAERKIYVNPSSRTKLMQLDDLDVKAIETSKPFEILNNGELMVQQMTTPAAYELDTEITTPSAYQLNLPKWRWSKVQIKADLKSHDGGSTQTFFTISEPGIWSERIRTNWLENRKVITEGTDFIAPSGYYNVLAEVKGRNSIEAEDYKTTSFSKDYAKKVSDKQVELHTVTITGVKEQGGHLTVDAVCKQCGKDNLVYAFLKRDDLGLTKLYEAGYTESNQVAIPNLNWNFEIVARVKHKEEGDTSFSNGLHGEMLKGSYEAQKVVAFEKGPNVSFINSVEVVRSINADKKPMENGGNKALQSKQTIGIGGSASAIAGEKNYITINPGNQDSSLQYKAWAIDDGVIIPLGEYSSSNEFVYYPKSGVGGGETHKLVVSVRQLNSNGIPTTKQTAEFTLNIQ